MKKPTTVMSWLELAEIQGEPWATAAIENYDRWWMPTDEADGFHDALICAFDPAETEEGKLFWIAVQDELWERFEA